MIQDMSPLCGSKMEGIRILTRIRGFKKYPD